MKDLEMCEHCNEPTGGAGRDEDSIICAECDTVICAECRDEFFENVVICIDCTANWYMEDRMN